MLYKTSESHFRLNKIQFDQNIKRLDLGKRMSLNNRTVTHQDLHPKTAIQKELFHTSSSLDWQPMIDHSRGMHSVNFL